MLKELIERPIDALSAKSGFGGQTDKASDTFLLGTEEDIWDSGYEMDNSIFEPVKEPTSEFLPIREREVYGKGKRTNQGI